MRAGMHFILLRIPFRTVDFCLSLYPLGARNSWHRTDGYLELMFLCIHLRVMRINPLFFDGKPSILFMHYYRGRKIPDDLAAKWNWRD